MKILASNKKAYFNFDVLDSIEAGIVLEGWEVKSAKGGRISLSGSYIKIKLNELWLSGATIADYKFSLGLHIPDRERKILLHRKEILKLIAGTKQEGGTLVPLEILENDKKIIKIMVALVKGRKRFDKRQVLKERDVKKRLNFDRKRYNI